MNRRKFLTNLGIGSLAVASQTPYAWAGRCRYNWRMVTAWPQSMPILQTGAQRYAELVHSLSGGQLKITVYAADELVGALEVFDTVSTGTVECGHSAAYYWEDKVPAAQWFTTVPFGLQAQDMNTWYYSGGGRELWQQAYADFNVLPVLAGNSGAQMGGWFNRPIRTEMDFSGLRMRMPGLGGKVVARLDAKVVLLPAGEIVPALMDGKINAAEWIGPYHDTLMGFQHTARYYYAPGWHEPGTAFEMIFNRTAFEKLPVELRSALISAAAVLNDDILSEFEYQNSRVLLQLAEERKVQLRLFPQRVLRVLARLSQEVLEEEAHKNAMAKEVHRAYKRFKHDMRRFMLLRGVGLSI
jgi:TRAP-type mannitol/chloroaromatic compound transport system substrate-binding protein